MSNIIETHIFAEIHWSARYFSILHYTRVAIHPPQLRALSSGEDTDSKLHQLISPFEWVPEQLSRFLTDPTIATLLEHPGQ